MQTQHTISNDQKFIKIYAWKRIRFYEILWNKLIKIKTEKEMITITTNPLGIKMPLMSYFRCAILFVKHSVWMFRAMKTLFAHTDIRGEKCLLMAMMLKINNVLIKTRTIQTIWSSSRLQTLSGCDCDCFKCGRFIVAFVRRKSVNKTKWILKKKKRTKKDMKGAANYFAGKYWVWNESDCVISVRQKRDCEYLICHTINNVRHLLHRIHLQNKRPHYNG